MKLVVLGGGLAWVSATLQGTRAACRGDVEGDHVALGIGHHRFSVEPWHGLDRGGCKPSFPKLSNIVLQVVHEEREHGLAGAGGVTDHVDPSGLCYLPHRTSQSPFCTAWSFGASLALR
jgi:hypothetical protein